MIDKKSIIIGIFAGMLLGIITSVFLASMIISSIGETFKIENMNITVAINQTQLENMIKESPRYRQQIEAKMLSEQELAKEYENGFLKGITSVQSHILFAGSTFEYGNRYVIKAQDILPNKVEIQVLQNGDYVFNGTCYENQICNIKDVSFQIDDIYIGKEASYFVYWSNE